MCIAIDRGIIDEDVILRNCIMILIEYYILFEKYIERESIVLHEIYDCQLKDHHVVKLDPWGEFYTKIKNWETPQYKDMIRDLKTQIIQKLEKSKSKLLQQKQKELQNNSKHYFGVILEKR